MLRNVATAVMRQFRASAKDIHEAIGDVLDDLFKDETAPYSALPRKIRKNPENMRRFLEVAEQLRKQRIEQEITFELVCGEKVTIASTNGPSIMGPAHPDY